MHPLTSQQFPERSFLRGDRPEGGVSVPWRGRHLGCEHSNRGACIIVIGVVSLSDVGVELAIQVT